VYENAKAGTAYVVEAKLKVMLEQDYLALDKNSSLPLVGRVREGENGINALGSQIVREIIIPELTREVNTGRNFAQLRQVYNSLILATWYKKKIKDSILAEIYENKNKIQGLAIPAQAGIHNKNNAEYIYQQYLKAFKKGAYNFIKEDIDPATRQSVPRKYFSGGVACTDLAMNIEIKNVNGPVLLTAIGGPENLFMVDIGLTMAGGDRAMRANWFQSPFAKWTHRRAKKISNGGDSDIGTYLIKAKQSGYLTRAKINLSNELIQYMNSLDGTERHIEYAELMFIFSAHNKEKVFEGKSDEELINALEYIRQRIDKAYKLPFNKEGKNSKRDAGALWTLWSTTRFLYTPSRIADYLVKANSSGQLQKAQSRLLGNCIRFMNTFQDTERFFVFRNLHDIFTDLQDDPRLKAAVFRSTLEHINSVIENEFIREGTVLTREKGRTPGFWQNSETPYTSSQRPPGGIRRRRIVFILGGLASAGLLYAYFGGKRKKNGELREIQLQAYQKDYLQRLNRVGVGVDSAKFINYWRTIDPHTGALPFTFDSLHGVEYKDKVLAVLSWLRANGSEDSKKKLGYIFGLMQNEGLKVSFHVGAKTEGNVSNFKYDLTGVGSPVSYLNITFDENLTGIDKLDLLIESLIVVFFDACDQLRDTSPGMNERARAKSNEAEKIDAIDFIINVDSRFKPSYPDLYHALSALVSRLKDSAQLGRTENDAAMIDRKSTPDEEVKWDQGFGLIDEIGKTYHHEVYSFGKNLEYFQGFAHMVGNWLNGIQGQYLNAKLTDNMRKRYYDDLNILFPALKQILERFSNYGKKDELKKWAEGFLSNYHAAPGDKVLYYQYRMAQFIQEGEFTEEFANRVNKLKQVYERNQPLIQEIVDYFAKRDHAMAQEQNGGIDLTSVKVDSRLPRLGGGLRGNDNGRDGQGIKFHIDPAQFQELQNAPGFTPVIINIQPLKSLPEFLGLNDGQSVTASG